jgi:tetratricopeptide (TPR) repeat protein
MHRTLVLFSLLLLSTAASAQDWLEASSDHFVIYSDQNEAAVRGFSERLELFHAAMAFVFKLPPAKPSPSNRVTIFVVSNAAKVRELSQHDNRFVAGVYIPRAGSSIALVPKRSGPTGQFDLQPETILYHEYAHHFMAGLTSRSFPRWFTEGFAEFFSGVKFRDDSVGLGTPANHRVLELAYARNVPIRNLLDYDGGASLKSRTYDSFYGQSWRLFHYLQFSDERTGQLTKYQQLLAEGETALAAAEGAFGDLDQLESDTERYSQQRKLAYVQISRTQLPIGPINVRALRPGEAAILLTRIRSTVGVDERQAQAVVGEARRITAQFPDDPVVLTALAEAEVDAGNSVAAIAAADKALGIDPGQVNAYIQKAKAMTEQASGTAMPKPTWKEVRSQWIKANKAENDHPIPLVQYYFTYLDEGQAPTRTAIDGLEWAMALAPFDSSIRWQAAQQMINDDRLADAVQTLAPLAYSPHPGDHTESALKLLRELEGRIRTVQSAP